MFTLSEDAIWCIQLRIPRCCVGHEFSVRSWTLGSIQELERCKNFNIVPLEFSFVYTHTPTNVIFTLSKNSTHRRACLSPVYFYFLEVLVRITSIGSPHYLISRFRDLLSRFREVQFNRSQKFRIGPRTHVQQNISNHILEFSYVCTKWHLHS